MCLEETLLDLLQKKPTVDCLKVILKFAIAEAQLIVMIIFTIVNNNNNKFTIAEVQLIVLITFTIVNNNNKIYNCWSTVDGVDNIHNC